MNTADSIRLVFISLVVLALMVYSASVIGQSIGICREVCMVHNQSYDSYEPIVEKCTCVVKTHYYLDEVKK